MIGERGVKQREGGVLGAIVTARERRVRLLDFSSAAAAHFICVRIETHAESGVDRGARRRRHVSCLQSVHAKKLLANSGAPINKNIRAPSAHSNAKTRGRQALL